MKKAKDNQKKLSEKSIYNPTTSVEVRSWLKRLRMDAGGKYYSEKGKFLSASLSTDLQRILHIITLKDTDEMFVYNIETGLYNNYGEKILRTIIKSVLGNGYSEHNAKATINDIKACGYTNRKNFVVPVQFLPVKNGVLDISKNSVELIHYSDEFYFTKKLPMIYNPKAKCPKFLKFLSEILPEEKFRIQIQEMFGWCLKRNYNHQYVFLLIGDGSNGKSKLLGALCALLGNQNVTSISLQRLCENRFMTSHLYGKNANILSDMPSKKITDSSIFKQLTGEDVVTAEKKHGAIFEFDNYAKLIFSTNKVPYSSDKSFAFYRRWVLVFFNVRFGDGGLPKDPKILKKITTPEEMSGILNWSLEGLFRLDKNDDFTERMSTSKTRDYYEKLVSPISSFLEENIIESDEDDKVNFITKDYLLDEIKKYCEKKQLLTRDVTKTKIAYIIRRNFMYIKSGQRTVGDIPRVRVWLNCKFKEDLNLDYIMWLNSFEE